MASYFLITAEPKYLQVVDPISRGSPIVTPTIEQWQCPAPGATFFRKELFGAAPFARNKLSSCEADGKILHATIRALTLISGSGCLLQQPRLGRIVPCRKHRRIGAIRFSESQVIRCTEPPSQAHLARPGQVRFITRPCAAEVRLGVYLV